LLNFDIIAALAAATALAGILRGYSGFGGGLVMAPLFTHLVGATNSVVLISARQVDLTVVGPLTITAILSVPLGVMLLGWLQPHLIKLVIAAVVVALALTMSFGLRLPGQPTRLKSALVGIISGALNGLCGMGGPPAVLYVLAGNQGSAELRASFILFFAVLYPVTVITLAVNGLITSPTFWVAIPMAPVYFAATEAGRLLFHHVRASWFTPICTAVLCLSGLSMFLS
jgi:uncharacterized membrane protein YfcA